MYLYIGQETVVLRREVVGIFDLENTTVSRDSRDFLAQTEKKGRVVSVGEDIPKSFIVCRNAAGEETVYLSQISCATLLKRAETIPSEITAGSNAIGGQKYE